MAATVNQKEACEYLGIKLATFRSLEERGAIKRLDHFDSPRYSAHSLARLAGVDDTGKTYREKALERQIAEKDQEIKSLKARLADIAKAALNT